VNALRNLQVEHHKIEASFFEEVHALECRYLSKYQPLYQKVEDFIHIFDLFYVYRLFSVWILLKEYMNQQTLKPNVHLMMMKYEELFVFKMKKFLLMIDL
jgi:hypothetical protein